MPKRKIFEKDGFYHVYNRGFQKQQIFFNHKDYERFFLKLEESLNFIKQVKLISYCVLPNHFHLIFQNKEEWLLLSKLMNKLQVAYWNFIKTKYWENLKKWQVFEWRFKAKLLESDDYFQKCLYYVNYNPLKHWIVDKIEDWPYIANPL